jgi:molybdopterin molybdotransferase
VGDVAASPQIEIMRAVAVGENVLGVGEDIVDGAQAYAAGHTLRPHDIGALMSLGMTKVDVAAPPRVAIVSSGDEIVAPTVAPVAGQVRDVNSYALGALVRQHGGAPMLYGIVPDRRDALDAALRRAHAECDIVMISAGSSVGARDLTVDAIAALGAPGVLAHGVALKPGKPAIVALCAGKAVFGLPGNPASALTVAELFVVPALRVALGASPVRAHTVRARLSRNVASSAGRVDVVPVNLAERDGELWATPIFGKSNLIYTLVRADGRITISLNDGGAREGDWVDVRL